jgi:hypothetical protein
MKGKALLIWVAGVSGLWAQSKEMADSFVLPPSEKPPAAISHEVEVDNSVTGGMNSRQGNRKVGDVSELQNKIHYVASTKLREDLLLRAGVEWERYSFGLPSQAPLPNTLQSTNLILGLDANLSSQWLVRLEISPGVYSDFEDIGWSDVNVPITLGASYFYSKDLQFFFGLSADFRREIPVLPGAGLRWKFAEQWTLMLLVPKPQIQYELLPNLMLYAGAELKAGTYQVDRKFGTNHQQFGRGENIRLDDSSVDYQEVRAGVGASWKFHQAWSLEAETGAVVLRTFDFHDEDYRIKSSGVAPYGRLGVKAEF